MAKLITCPECNGEGIIKIPHPPPAETSHIEANLKNFTGLFGASQPDKKLWRTCPTCNGFGMVREKKPPAT